MNNVEENTRERTSKNFNEHDDLLVLIKDLTERIQMLSWAVQQYVNDIYVHYTVTKTLEQINYRNRKTKIETDYNKVVEEVSNSQEIRKVDEFNSLYSKLTALYKSFEDVCLVAEAKKVLLRASHEFGRHNYCEAMTAVIQLQRELKEIDTLQGEVARALAHLMADVETHLALYVARLSVLWEDLFQWSDRRSAHSHTMSLSVQQADPALIETVLKTLYATERLNAELNLFSHFFINILVHHIIRHNCEIFTDDIMGAIVFNIKIDLTDSKKPNHQTIFNNLTAVFEFLQSTLGSRFESDKKFIEVFADSIRNEFFDKLINDCIRNNLPSCDSSFEHYKNIVVELDAFNKCLIELRFIEASESPLNKYIEDTECVLYNKKCDKLLSDVRSLLGESLSHGTVVVGLPPPCEQEATTTTTTDISHKNFAWDINAPLFLPECVVSQNVKRLVSLIVQHLEESARLPERYQQRLTSYIRDIVVMYQCVVSKKFKVNLESCPLDIALFFNNCCYVCHALATPYSSHVAPALALLDVLHDLRLLGMEKVALYLSKLRDKITDAFELNDTSGEWSEALVEQYSCAMSAGVETLADLQDCWQGVVPARLWTDCGATLARALAAAGSERALALLDAARARDSHVFMLALAVEDAVHDVQRLFQDTVELGSVSEWRKLCALPPLLRAQLEETRAGWRGEGGALSADEVRRVVRARFTDDKQRLRVLRDIQ